jgi:hypothetical protein
MRLRIESTSGESPLLVVLAPDESKLQHAPDGKKSEPECCLIARVLSGPKPAALLGDTGNNGIRCMIWSPITLQQSEPNTASRMSHQGAHQAATTINAGASANVQGVALAVEVRNAAVVGKSGGRLGKTQHSGLKAAITR